MKVSDSCVGSGGIFEAASATKKCHTHTDKCTYICVCVCGERQSITLACVHCPLTGSFHIQRTSVSVVRLRAVTKLFCV